MDSPGMPEIEGAATSSTGAAGTCSAEGAGATACSVAGA